MKMSPLRIAIVTSQFNSLITTRLLNCCTGELARKGISNRQLTLRTVPGAYELPYAAYKLAKSKRFDAVIALGCVIKGQTSHDEHISNWASIGIGLAGLTTEIPVLFGVLTPKNEAQALLRTKQGKFDRGAEIARSALSMIEFEGKL